jgi:hypothetical protein
MWGIYRILFSKGWTRGTVTDMGHMNIMINTAYKSEAQSCMKALFKALSRRPNENDLVMVELENSTEPLNGKTDEEMKAVLDAVENINLRGPLQINSWMRTGRTPRMVQEDYVNPSRFNFLWHPEQGFLKSSDTYHAYLAYKNDLLSAEEARGIHQVAYEILFDKGWVRGTFQDYKGDMGIRYATMIHCMDEDICVEAFKALYKDMGFRIDSTDRLSVELHSPKDVNNRQYFTLEGIKIRSFLRTKKNPKTSIHDRLSENMEIPAYWYDGNKDELHDVTFIGHDRWAWNNAGAPEGEYSYEWMKDRGWVRLVVQGHDVNMETRTLDVGRKALKKYFSEHGGVTEDSYVYLDHGSGSDGTKQDERLRGRRQINTFIQRGILPR